VRRGGSGAVSGGKAFVLSPEAEICRMYAREKGHSQTGSEFKGKGGEPYVEGGANLSEKKKREMRFIIAEKSALPPSKKARERGLPKAILRRSSKPNR